MLPEEKADGAGREDRDARGGLDADEDEWHDDADFDEDVDAGRTLSLSVYWEHEPDGDAPAPTFVTQGAPGGRAARTADGGSP